MISGDTYILEKETSLFTPIHITHTLELTIFFISGDETYRVIDCKIPNFTLSDHAPVSLGYGRGCFYETVALNNSVLGNPAFQTYIESEFKYLDMNNTRDLSVVIHWEAAKAVLRGTVLN